MIIYVGFGLLALFILGLFVWESRRYAALTKAFGKTTEETAKISAALQILQTQMTNQLSFTAQLLQGQDKTLGERLGEVHQVVADLRERIGTMEEISRRVESLAQELTGLEALLRAPKARGVFGEWTLSELLSQVLPRGRFQQQYRFRDGSVVDAVIFLENGIVPVDAKFPVSGFMELRTAESAEERKRLKKNLIRNAQKHVDSIAQKYIKPDEGTADFALMYIPAEGVFLELLSPEEDIDFLAYAWNRRVFLCSPNTFYSYLQAISMGLRGLELAENVKIIFGELKGLEGILENAVEEFSTLGNHLRNAQRKWDEVEKSFRSMRDKLLAIARKS